MVVDAPLSHDASADGLLDSANPRPALLDRLNRIIDRLFGFELEPDELRCLDEIPRSAARLR